MEKELTSRQIQERADYEAEQSEKADPPVQTRMSTRDYLRKKAGWPALRSK